MKFPVLAALAALSLATAAAPSAMAMGTAGVILDPKCLSESAWEVDATTWSVPIIPALTWNGRPIRQTINKRLIRRTKDMLIGTLSC